MSLNLQLTSTAWLSALPKGISKLVLLCFCNHANDVSGLSWPSIARVARMCGMSERTVQCHVRALQRAGILRARLRTGRTTKYAIDLSSLQALEFAAAPVDNFADAPELEGLTPADPAPSPAKYGTPPPQIATSTPAVSAPITVLTFKQNITESGTGAPALPATLMMVDGVNSQVMADFAAVRHKKRKGPVTATVIEDICQQAGLASLTLEQALRICCSRNWARFDAAWLQPADRGAAIDVAPALCRPLPPPAKPACPTVVQAGRLQLAALRKTITSARLGSASNNWAHATLEKVKAGQRVSRIALQDACAALRLNPASLSTARMH